MIESLIHFLELNILPWGAFGVFLASVIEEVIAPIPSALVMTMSGFLLISGPISIKTILILIFKVAVPAAFGVTLGSLVIYYAAKFGGEFLVEKWGKYLGLYWSDIKKLESQLSITKKEGILIIGARVIPFVPSVAISAFCGFIRMNISKYFLLTFCGMFLRSVIMGAIGWQVGNVYYKYALFISHIENYILWIVFILFLIFTSSNLHKRKK